MPSQYTRFGALISITGSLLVILGVFLPLVTLNGALQPYPVSEWHIVSCPIISTSSYCPPSTSSFDLGVRLILLIPFIFALTILSVSFIAYLRSLPLLFVLLLRILAILGLTLQLLISVLFLLGFTFGAALNDGGGPPVFIDAGSIFPLLGFIATIIGAFFVRAFPHSVQQDAART